MQSKLESLVEQSLNVLSGLVISIFIVQPIVWNYYGVTLSTSQNISVAVIFTVISIIRGYFWRRLYNKKLIKKLLKENKDNVRSY